MISKKTCATFLELMMMKKRVNLFATLKLKIQMEKPIILSGHTDGSVQKVGVQIHL